MVDTIDYASYLLRIWRDQIQKDTVDVHTWTIEVESIQSGDSWRFADITSLIAFLEGVFLALEDRGDR